MNSSISKPLFLNLLLLLFFNSCYNPNSSEIIQDIKALSGRWESYKGVKFSENWRTINDSLLQGEGFSLNGADTAFYESLSILKEEDSVYYRVFIGDEKMHVDFLLVHASKKSWTFINPENEFPEKIVYKIQKDSLLTVTISDMKVNKKQLFYLKKIKD
jgi:outer membrane lipoprotein-sorting protein